ncbi:DUF4440 domain-containing protein [Olleya sp. Bg11-27]|uniref:DUF4440 domain-containing protein n=1 Tax=Olleya sp. Bg11-27 TaxID=2058135 RepID=UPI000C302884|nr:DUF4440 domain-containing protein [Olleya sp. Bg11-27]AUC77262.1 nuclear transport factor 2 family protein [Olleya sp. Bg11-27]
MKHSTLILAFLFSLSALSQVKKQSELHRTLAINDSLLFTEGLNKCNPSLMAKYIHSDFEFYHDKGGIDKGKQLFIKNIETMCAGEGMANKRILVRGSLIVYPLYDNKILYGAIQHGEHKFGDSTPKFTHLWLLEDATWKLSRVLSYDH